MATQSPTSEVLTLFDAAKLLKVSEKTLSAQARAGKVPHFKIGKQYRFNKAELLDWARSSKSPTQG
jgi:PTS system nitrogen regulatory IIA component